MEEVVYESIKYEKKTLKDIYHAELTFAEKRGEEKRHEWKKKFTRLGNEYTD